MLFNSKQINHLDSTYRKNLINCLSGCKPAHLIGTIGRSGLSNLAVFTNILHMGANPPYIGILCRPVGLDSHTYKNIVETGFFTLNHVHIGMAEKAHFTSARFSKDVSEFSACKLTEEYKQGFQAPFVRESYIQVGLKLVQEHKFDLNGTILLIGSVELISLPDKLLQSDGNLNLESSDNICAGGLETYYKVSQFKQFPYAKIDRLPDFD